MNGIERLRAIAGAWDEWGLGGTLAEIADQIERELDRHDEPDSTDKGACPPYVTDEDREALEWVRKYGGIGCVQTMAAALGDTLSWIRERAGVGEDEVVDYDELLDALDRRLMPEGYEWPRYESGEPLRYEDRYVCDGREREVWHVDFDSCGEPTILNKDGTRFHPDKGERVKRPAVLAADGEPLEVGQMVWDANGDELVVGALEDGGNTATCRYADVGDGIPVHGMWSPSDLTHQRPVLDANGVPIETCQKMWRVRNGEEVRVSQIDRGEHPLITYIGEDGLTHEITPDGLTHTKPEPKRICGDCRHWQGDPSASHMGVCFNSYRERCCVDSYAAQLDYAKACDDFEERSE